jgi:C4-dicarboxylate-binding protein DctP
MKKGLTKLVFLLLPLVLWGQPAPGTAAPSRVLRVSLENTVNHIQTRTVLDFASEVENRLHGGMRVEVVPEARLFRDRDILNALHGGRIEMGVPGMWNLEPDLPGLGVFLLPFMYGRSAEDYHLLSDGPVGASIISSMEKMYEVHILGSWLDLGHSLVFTVDRPLTGPADFRNLLIRVAGGKANELRIRALGGRGVTVPWPELPEQLRNRAVGGVLTTYETVRSGELWRYGLRYAFEDRQYFAMYLPVLSRRFWDGLDRREQEVLRSAWETAASRQRKESHGVQLEAKRVFIEKGGRVVVPDAAAVKAARDRLVTAQSSIAGELEIPAALIRAAEIQLDQ